jgi:chromosome segregation ATPase
MTVLDDALNNGKLMNDSLNNKIQLLGQTNEGFKQNLNAKLQEIYEKIMNFKDVNVSGLTNTKEQLQRVTAELDKTKSELQATQSKLSGLNSENETLKKELININEEKKILGDKMGELDRQINDLQQKMNQSQMEYENKIANVGREMAAKTTEEKKAMEADFNQKMAQFNQEKMDLQRQIEAANNATTKAANDLQQLQQTQNDLIAKVGQINDLLTNQISMINGIQTDMPNMNDYNGILKQIVDSLSEAITNVQTASSGTSAPFTQQPSSIVAPLPSVAPSTEEYLGATPYYTKFRSLNDAQRKAVINALPEFAQDKINNINLSTIDSNQKNIINQTFMTANNKTAQDALNRLYSESSNKAGGRKRRRTMKRRQRKTKKNMRGGYVYKTNKTLENSSSVVSGSSRSSSRSKRFRKTHRSR